MVLSGDVSDVKMPGQFINIKIDGFYLRRPMSISECENEKLTIIYKLRGAGTEKMTELSAGAKLDVLCAAGNGFDVRKAKGRVAIHTDRPFPSGHRRLGPAKASSLRPYSRSSAGAILPPSSLVMSCIP